MDAEVFNALFLPCTYVHSPERHCLSQQHHRAKGGKVQPIPIGHHPQLCQVLNSALIRDDFVVNETEDTLKQQAADMEAVLAQGFEVFLGPREAEERL